jgi:predicted 3-demethylubiquinone-9 3-methyltransferase (glyoxalase superfamily)
VCNAENHSIPLVAQQRRRGNELLSLCFQELEDRAGVALRRCGTRPEGIVHGREFFSGGAAVHGAERRAALQADARVFAHGELRDTEEVDYYWDKLSEGGTEVQCGWLTDKFGVSWQIVPTMFTELLRRGDGEKNNRMMQALYNMKKLIIADLQRRTTGSLATKLC